MEEQLKLYSRKLTIDERFDQWVKDNPHIIGYYLKFARQILESGGRHYSINALTERVRWEVRFVWKEKFKINNNYRAPLARYLVVVEPRLAGMFECRRRKS